MMRLGNRNLFSQGLEKLLSAAQVYKKSLINYLKKHEHKLANLIETNYQLGLFHLRAKNLSDAEFRFKLVVYFQPKHYQAIYHLARCLYAKNKIEKAREKLLNCLKINNNFQEAKYLLSVIDDKSDISHIPNSIIEEYYDNLAEYYDEEFSHANGYRLAEHLVDLLAHYIKDRNKSYKVLDLGCGTGQCSDYLVDKIKITELIGIDLSQNMLEKAKYLSKKDSYIFNKLVKVDYLDYIEKTKNKYDIIISGLALHFHKNLLHVFKGISSILLPSGIVAFSIEKSLSEKDASLNYSCENFCYKIEYIKKTIKDAGLKLISFKEHQIKNDRLAFVVICKK